MGSLFAVLVILATISTTLTARAEVRVVRTRSIVGLAQADIQLLSECRLFLMRPDLRTPAQRGSLADAFRQREAKWKELGDDVNVAENVGRTRAAIRAACNSALAGQTVGSDLPGALQQARALLPAPQQSAGPQPNVAHKDEQTAWSAAEVAGTRENYQEFIARYPSSANIALARARLESLSATEAAQKWLDTFEANRAAEAESAAAERSGESSRSGEDRHQIIALLRAYKALAKKEAEARGDREEQSRIALASPHLPPSIPPPVPSNAAPAVKPKTTANFVPVEVAPIQTPTVSLPSRPLIIADHQTAEPVPQIEPWPLPLLPPAPSAPPDVAKPEAISRFAPIQIVPLQAPSISFPMQAPIVAEHQTAEPVPQIEPWPPPIPTDQAIFGIDTAKMKTVGNFSDAIMERLNNAGLRHLRFWGAPNGVAVVAPLEAVDAAAHPLGRNRSSAGLDTNQGGPLAAVIEGFRRLLSEPIRDSRIFLIVLTTDSKVKNPDVTMTTQIARNWTQNEYMRPDVNRDVALTDQHFVVVNVYEFRKERKGDPQLLTQDRMQHHVAEHLAASQLDLSGLLK
jgi:hypothetical protein